MPPAGTRARVPSGNIDSDAAWDLHVLGPGGLARWTAEAEARVREGACGAYASRTVVDLTSQRPPDPERDIILWRDRLHSPENQTFEALPDSPLAPARDSGRLTDAYGREDEAERERNESTVNEHEHDAMLSAVRDISLDISRRPPRDDKKQVSSTRLSSALRRLAAPSAFAATRAVAAHSPHALDRRIDGTARRARATRDETVDALAANARRDVLRNRRRAREAAKNLFFAAKRDDDSLSLSDVAAAASFKSGARADVLVSDDASSLSSFAAADSDDGVASRRREGATPTSKAKARPFSFRSRRVPKAPPFPAPPRETARAFLWAEKRVDHEVCTAETAETAERSADPASPRDALERFFGPAFFQTQRLDAATRLAAETSRYANETENALAYPADVYSAAASAAVARARARHETTKNAVRRENREETARSRRAAAVAAEAARVARRRRELAGANVSRSAASSVRRRNEDAARKQKHEQKQRETSSRARTANRGPGPDPGPGPGPGGSGALKNSLNKSAKRFERRETNVFFSVSDDAFSPEMAPLPAHASRILDLTWNPHACAPPDGVFPAGDEKDENASVFGSRKPKHPSLLPYSPANAEACARFGDKASSRRLRDWCAYAGVETRADATDGGRATVLKRAYLDALFLIEKLAPGVSAAAAAVTTAETKRRHAEARERKGRIPRFGDGKTTRPSARQKNFGASNLGAPRDDGKFARRNHPEWKT